MPQILIVDACKPSVVMSSEVFKDKIPGISVLIASTGKQCLEILAEAKPDMCVVDFDLPDTDGVTLIHAIRKNYRGPILLTAYPDQIVADAVKNDLFHFNDAGAWISKPVQFDDFSAKIDKFLLDKYRLGRRFEMAMDTLIIGKGAGRGKRSPKVTGKIVNISLGGACIELDEPMRLKGGEELLVAVPFPDPNAAKPAKLTPHAKALAARKKSTSKPDLSALEKSEAKVKCTVAWVDKKFTKAGFKFVRLSDVQKKAVEAILRDSFLG